MNNEMRHLDGKRRKRNLTPMHPDVKHVPVYVQLHTTLRLKTACSKRSLPPLTVPDDF